MEGLAGLKELRRLLLRDTMVTDEGLKHLAGLTQLEELDLSGTRATDRGIEFLRKLTAMRKLNLLGARATDASMDMLAGMKHLQVVNLYRTQMTNAGLARLQELKELTDVDLRYSRVSSNGVESLRAALPDSKVQFVGSHPCARRPRAAARPAANTDQAIAAWVKALGGTAEFAGERCKAIDLSSTPSAMRSCRICRGLTGLEKLNLEVTQVGDLGLAAIAGSDRAEGTQSQQHHRFRRRAGETRRPEPAAESAAGRHPGRGHEASPPWTALQELRELDLAGTRVDDEALAFVGKMSALERLRLSQTDVATTA